MNKVVGCAAFPMTRHGVFGILVDADGVLASGWVADGDIDALIERVHPSLRPDLFIVTDRNGELLPSRGRTPEALARLRAAIAAVRAYDDGSDPTAVNTLKLHTAGGPFHEAVRQAMRTIAPGERLSYAEVAARAGRPRAIRAAGAACAGNPVPLFVPCHRIVASDGRLAGFAFGLPLKEALLAEESAWAAAHPRHDT